MEISWYDLCENPKADEALPFGGAFSFPELNMTTKVRITHLDSIDKVEAVIMNKGSLSEDGVAPDSVQSVVPLHGKGDEHEVYVYSSQYVVIREVTSG